MYFTAKYYYYHNHGYKSYITSLKAVITGKSLITAGLDIDRIRFLNTFHFFMIKHSKFTDNIGSGNFTDTFCQNTHKFQNTSPPFGTALPLPTNFRKVILYNSKNNDVSSVIFDAYLKI